VTTAGLRPAAMSRRRRLEEFRGLSLQHFREPADEPQSYPDLAPLDLAEMCAADLCVVRQSFLRESAFMAQAAQVEGEQLAQVRVHAPGQRFDAPSPTL
jgi:hypothetical protein